MVPARRPEPLTPKFRRTWPQAAAARGETVDLFEYLDSLPEVEDPFPPSEPDPEPAPEPERKPAEMLAEYIRERTKVR